MLDDEGLAELIREIEAQGYDRVTAGHYAALVGDTPEFDRQGNIIVRDDRERVVATLKPLKMFEG